jgi:drug/metabolite transporter (DMT)-like permease
MLTAMNKQQAYVWGVFCSFFSAFVWGTSHISGRYMMSNNCIDIISLCSMRYTVGGLVMLGLGLAFYRKKIFAVSRNDILKLVLLGSVGMVLHTFFILSGQKHTSAVNSALILALSPIMAMLIGVFVGHKAGVNKILGMLLSLFGSLLVIGVINKNGFCASGLSFYGDFMIFISALCWALYTVLSSKIVNRLGGFTATTWCMLAGAVQFLMLQLFLPYDFHIPAASETTPWLVIAYVILFPTAAGFYFFYEAMSRIKLSLLNIMQYLTPIVTIVLSYLLLGEKMTALNLIGAGLTLFGVMIVSGNVKISFCLRPDIQNASCVQTEN